MTENSDIFDLQARVAFQEDLLSNLNQQIVHQHQSIQVLQQQLKHICNKVEGLTYDIEQRGITPSEKPPHY